MFLGKFATWKNNNIRDIGTTSILKKAQKDIKPSTIWSINDQWKTNFLENNINY